MICYHVAMSRDFLSKQLVDHHLQAEILKRLSCADTSLRFSKLKEAGIENSLFMYHANKLIDRELIAKTDNGFELTTKGARWSNHAGLLTNFHAETPRPLIQFIIEGPNDTILVVSRVGHIKELLNAYMLPGDIYHYGLSLDENAFEYLRKLFGNQKFEPKLITIADFIQRYDDGFTHHVISHIFKVIIEDSSSLNKLDGYNIDWVPKEIITVNNKAYSMSPFLPMIIEKRNSLLPHETFIVED